MFQLFDNYDNLDKIIPDNEYVFIKLKRKYKDIIVLGGTNKHSSLIPCKFEDLNAVTITYIQGTEVKLSKTFYADLFSETPEEDCYVYVDGSTKLYEVNRKELPKLYVFENEADKSTFDYCLLFFEISADESLLFNDWNKEVFVQAKFIPNSEVENIKYTDKFRIKIVKTIDNKEDINNTSTEFGWTDGGSSSKGFGWTED